MKHQITVTTSANYAQMRDVTCTCGYHAEAHHLWADRIVAEHSSNPAAHLDTSKIHS